MQRATVMRGLAAGPDRFEGRSRYNSLSPRGRPSGLVVRRGGANSDDFEGACPTERKFLLEGLLSAPFRSPCRTVAAVLYTHTQSLAAYLGPRRNTCESVELRPFMRATVWACFSRTRARRRVVAVLGRDGNRRDSCGQGSGGLRRGSDRRRRGGGGAVSVRRVLRWKRGLSRS